MRHTFYQFKEVHPVIFFSFKPILMVLSMAFLSFHLQAQEYGLSDYSVSPDPVDAVEDTLSVNFKLYAPASIFPVGPPYAISVLFDFYLSKDSVFDYQDYWLGVDGFSTQDSIADYTIKRRISYVVPPGNYYFITRLDFNNQHPLLHTGKSVAAAPLTLLYPVPDLQAYSIHLDKGQLYPGEKSTFDFTLQKEGFLPADSIQTAYFLSSDTLYSFDDIQIGNLETPPSFFYGPAQKVYEVVYPPSDIEPGNYHLLVVADPSEIINEKEEGNNVAHVPVSLVIPEFEVTSTTSYLSLNGNVLSGYAGVQNNAAFGNILEFPAGIFLSSDTIVDSLDILIKESKIALNTVGQGSDWFSDTLPPGFAPGNYYVITVADHKNRFQETNEENNTSFAPVYIDITSHVDLEFAQVSSYPVITGSDQVSLPLFLKNTGSENAGSSNVVYQLLDASGQVISTGSAGYTGIILPGDIKELTLTLRLPLEGVYFARLIADADNVVYEYDETNNTSDQIIIYFTITGISDDKQSSSFTVAPVPAHNVFTIFNHVNSSALHTLYNCRGEIVWQSKEVPSTEMNVNTDDFGTGLFLLRTYTTNGIIENKVILH